MGLLDSMLDSCDSWSIEENDEFITDSTWMDNFDMDEFLHVIGVKANDIDWSEFPFNISDYKKNKNKDWRDLLYED